MKKLNCAKTLIVAVIISMTAIFFLPQILLAKKAKEVKIVVSGSLYPEYGELLGLNMYFSALQGLSIRNPDLKKSVKIKVVDKGILCGSQDECLTMVSSGTAQMTYSSPHFLEQLMPEWKLGDNLYVSKGKLATNAQLVENAIDIIQKLGGDISSVKEARKTLNLREQ